MSRLVPYRSQGGKILQDQVGPGGDTPPAARLEAVGKFVPAEILAFYLPASGAAQVAQASLVPVLQWLTFFIGWAAVPVYMLWIAEGDERGGRQAIVSSIAFPIWVMASATFWPIPYMARDAGLALWLLALFSLVTAFLLPSKHE